jgi:hypothetical protein
MVVIVKQPRVNIAFAQRRLDGSQLHGQTFIVNNGKDLSESRSRNATGVTLVCGIIEEPRSDARLATPDATASGLREAGMRLLICNAWRNPPVS